MNASPLNALGKVGLVDLLHGIPEELLIPEGVAAEVRAGPEDDPARKWLEGAGGRFCKAIGNIHPLVAAWDLGQGEMEVLSWAKSNAGWVAIVDDRAARQCVAALGIPVRGTLGVLLLAKARGKIPVVAPVLAALERAGWYLDPVLRKEALRNAGEP